MSGGKIAPKRRLPPAARPRRIEPSPGLRLALGLGLSLCVSLSLALSCGKRAPPVASQTVEPTGLAQEIKASKTPDAPGEIPSAAPVDRGPSPEQVALKAWRGAHPQTIELDLAVHETRWFYAAFGLADRETMPTAFKNTSFDVEHGSLLLVTKISEGVGQPRYHYYTLGDTGWAAAPKHFVPASTVKLMASVAALWTLSTRGLDGDSKLSFKDIDGHYYGSAYKLYKDALLHSSNQNYNRLMAIAGFDETNAEYLTPEQGFPVMAIQSRYGKSHKSYGIRTSPTIGYKDGDKAGEIPKRKGGWRTDQCRGNCTTLFELQDIMRRVILHDEIPVEERFPLARVDLKRIQALLLEARNRLQPSPNKAFEEKVEVYNSVGRIPGRVLLENSLLLAPESGRRVMLALSLRFPEGQDPIKQLRYLARAALDATLSHEPLGPGLQRDAGVEIKLEIRRDQSRLALLASASASEVDSIVIWDGNTALPRTLELNEGEQRWAAAHSELGPRDALIVAIASKDGKEVGYRSWRLTSFGSDDSTTIIATGTPESR